MFCAVTIGGSFSGLGAGMGWRSAGRDPRTVSGKVAAMWNVNFAVDDGARAGAGCHQSLLFPDFIPALEKEAA